MNRRVHTLLVSCVLVAGACSAGDDAIPFSVETTPGPSTTLIAPPIVELTAGEAHLVRVHGSWVCDLQKRTFETPSEIPEALAEHLQQAGTDQAVYDEFVAELGRRQDLRDAALFDFQQNCLR